MTSVEDGEINAVGNKLPYTQQDWWDKRRATDTVLEEVGGIVTRVGDETVGEMWSLFDGQDVLNEVDPRFSENIRNHIAAGSAQRSVPCLGEHRPEGRPLESAAGPGSRHAAPRREGDGCRDRRARRQIRDGGGLREPGLHQADDRQLGERSLFRLCARLHLRSRLAGTEVHLPHRLCRTRAGGGLSALQPRRRGRHAAHLRRRADPLGECALLPPHQGGGVHPRHAAPLFGLRLRAAQPEACRHDDRRGALQRAADRPGQAAGGAGEARAARRLPRGHQRASDRSDRALPSAAPAG